MISSFSGPVMEFRDVCAFVFGCTRIIYFCKCNHFIVKFVCYTLIRLSNTVVFQSGRESLIVP